MSKLQPLRAIPSAALLFAAAALLLCFGPLARTAEAVEFVGAWQDLDQLKRSTKSRSTNEDLLQYLDAVFTNYKELKGPPKPADDASEEEKKAPACSEGRSSSAGSGLEGDAHAPPCSAVSSPGTTRSR